MATPLALVWDLIASDNASPTFARVAATADKAAASTDRASASAAGFGKKMLGAFAGIAAIDIGAHMVKDAVQFQKSMTLIQTQAGASASTVKLLSDAVLKMSGSVGTGPMALSDALYHIVSAGQGILSTSQELAALKVAAEGAKVGNANLTETTNALTAAITSGIGGVQNMSQAMGALNAIVGGGDMKLSDLNDALGSGILTQAKIFGLSLRDVGAALDVFGDNNIRGANAGGMLKQSIMALAKPVATGAKELDHLGLSSTQLAQDMGSGGLNKALVDLKAHLPSGDIASLTKQIGLMNGNVDVSAVAASSLGAILTTVFGKKAGPGIAILVDQLQRFQIKQDEISKGATGFGLAWKATQGTASFALSSISAEASAASIAIGDKLLPMVTAVAKWLGNELPGAAHTAAAAFAPFESIFGAVGGAAKTTFGGISDVVKPVGPELRDITEIALAMWAGFKAGTLAAAAVQFVGTQLRALGEKAVLGAADALVALGGVSAAADATAADVALAGETASVGWAGIAGPLGAAAVGIITMVSLFGKSSSASKEATAAAKAYADALSGGSKSDLLDSITSQLASNNVPQKIADLNKALGSVQVTAGSFANAIQQGGAPLDTLRKHLQDIIAAGLPTAAAMEKAGVSVNAKLSPAAQKATQLLTDLNAQFGALSKQTQKDLVDTKAFAGVSASIDNVAQSTSVAAGTASTYAGMLGIAVDKNGVAAVSSTVLAAAVQTVSNAYAKSTQTGNDFLTALNSFSSSAGGAADRAALIGATLKAANGDALNFAAAMNGAAVANHSLVTDMQSAAKAVGKNGESMRSYIKSIVDLKTGTIDYTKSASGPLISDLQSLQTAGMNAAEAMYQHALAIGQSKTAADDAYKVYVSQTQGSLIDEAKQLGLTKDQAKKLADQYFGMPKSVKTLIEQEGANPVVTVLNKIGQQLAYLTGHPWTPKVSTSGIDSATSAAQRLIDKLASVGNAASAGQVANATAGGPGGHHAAGGSVKDGWFTVGEQGYEIGRKSGNQVQIFSNAQSRAMTGMARVPGYASGTNNSSYYVRGVGYASERAAHNAALADMKAQITLGLKIDGKDLANFNKSIKGTVAQAQASFATLFADTQKLGVSSSLLKALKSEDNALNKEIGVRNSIAAKLAAVKASMSALASSTGQAISGFFNVTGAGANPITGAVTGAGIAAQQRQALTQIQQFSAGIKKLEGRHLNTAYLESIAAAGPSALPQVQALLSLPSLSGINATEKQIQSLAASTGAGVANSVYGAQASSLAAQEKAADARANALAKKLDASFEKAVTKALSTPIIATYKGKTLFEITRAEEQKATRR